MHRVLVGAALVAGCGQSVPAKPSQPIAKPSPGSAPVVPPRAAFAVVPAELGDERILDRLRHRVIVHQWGLAWLSHDGTPIGHATDATEAGEILPVIDERNRKIRVLVEDDHARFAMWIARDDAGTTVLSPIQLGDRSGTPAAVWLEPGIPLTISDRNGPLHHVAIIDELVTADGWLDPGAVGNVWVAQPGDVPDLTAGRHLSYSPPKHRGDQLLRLAKGSVIRASADPASRALATLADETVVRKIAAGASTTEVELRRQFFRAQGFVANAQVVDLADDFTTRGRGTGHGFGMSHASKHLIPAGTCLYDRADGDVIGVAIETDTHLGRTIGDDNWAMVYIDTPWNVASMYVKNLGPDRATPSWDSCTEPAHRR